MLKPRPLIAIAGVLGMLFCAFWNVVAQEGSNLAGCTLIDSRHPAQFISYGEGSKKTSEVTLRLHNNTNCSIVVETDDREPTPLIKLTKGAGSAKTAIRNEEDDVRIPLHYLVQDRRRWRAAEPGYGWGDSVFSYELGGGRSAIFLVPSSAFKKGLDIAVPFKYRWEGSQALGMGVGGVIHRVYFLVQDLP